MNNLSLKSIIYFASKCNQKDKKTIRQHNVNRTQTHLALKDLNKYSQGVQQVQGNQGDPTNPTKPHVSSPTWIFIYVTVLFGISKVFNVF